MLYLKYLTICLLNQIILNFLFSGCDMDSPRRPSPEGKGEEEAFDGQSALHLACAWGLEQVVQTLIEHGADVNLQVQFINFHNIMDVIHC